MRLLLLGLRCNDKCGRGTHDTTSELLSVITGVTGLAGSPLESSLT